jgi:hypothetical protein
MDSERVDASRGPGMRGSEPRALPHLTTSFPLLYVFSYHSPVLGHLLTLILFPFYLATGHGTTTLPLLTRSVLVFNPLAWLRPRTPVLCNLRPAFLPSFRLRTIALSRSLRPS